MTVYSQNIKVDEELRLELIDEHHAEETFKVIDANREHLRVWLPWVDYTTSVEGFKNYILFCKQKFKEGADYGYIIRYGNIVAGRIGLHHVDTNNKSASIGYWLAKDQEGKGIITRSCKALINFGFHELQLNRIEIKHGDGNDKSGAVPQKLGFKREGLLRQAELVNGKFIDLHLYSLLKEEWLSVNHQA